MATRGKPLDAATVRVIVRARDALSIRQAARVTGTSRNTVRKYQRGIKS